MWSVACGSDKLLLCCWFSGAGDKGEPKELWLSKDSACGPTIFGVAGVIISPSLFSAFVSVLLLLSTSGTSEEVNSWDLGDFSMGEKIVSSGTLQDTLCVGGSGAVLLISVTLGGGFLLSDGFLLREGTRTILPLSFCSLSSVSTGFRRFISLCRTAVLHF